MKNKVNKIKKLILHIGAHKTGTTAIQSFLYKNSDKINKHGFYIPYFLPGYNNKPTDLRFSIIKKDTEKTRLYLKEIVTRASDLSCNTVIISDENYCKTEEVDFENVKIFGEYFDEIEVMLYCRRHDRELESRYAFLVMWEGAKLSDSPSQWYKRYKGRDYFEIAKFYENQIKGCNIKIISYDMNANCLIDSFINACEIPQDNYAMPNKADSNISPNRYIIEVMCELNQYFMNEQQFLKVREYILNHKLLQNGPNALFYNIKERKNCENLFSQSTQALIDTYHNKKPIFDELKDIPLPKGLDKKIKENIIKETVKQFNLHYCKEPDTMTKFKKQLKVSSKILLVDIYRDIAIVLEKLHMYGSSYRFMSYAQYLRPDGQFINKKLNKLIKILFTDTENKLLKNYDYQTIIQIKNIPLYDKKIVDIAIKEFKEAIKIPFFITKKKIYIELAKFFNGYDETIAREFFQKIEGINFTEQYQKN